MTGERPQSSFPRKRESRVFAFPFFLDTGSGSGMTEVSPDQACLRGLSPT